jgi:putative flippase GtrA
VRKEFIVFSLVGTAAFVVDAGILYLLKSSFGIYWGRAASFFCAVCFTWVLNRNFTFKARISGNSLLLEFWQYFGVMLGGGAVNYFLYALLVTKMEVVADQPIWGVAAGSCAGLLFNFILARVLIFKRSLMKN